MNFIIKLVGVIEEKDSGNCNSLVGTGEEAKCCGEAGISSDCEQKDHWWVTQLFSKPVSCD